MCLAVPGKIESIGGDGIASVDFMGVGRDVSLAFVPGARVGEYVLVHAGFAIEVLSEERALETIELAAELTEALEEVSSGAHRTQAATKGEAL